MQLRRRAAGPFGSTATKPASAMITLKAAFTSRTITTLSATGQDKKSHTEFGPLTPGFVYAFDASDAGSVGRLARGERVLCRYDGDGAG